MNSIYNSFYNNLIAEERYRMILDGLQVTLLITFCAVILGTILGAIICWMRMNRHPWLQKIAKVYIDIMRGTPVLVLLMLMYYVIMAPLEATGIVVAIVTFGMNTAAYISEMLRSAIQGIDRGQTEAGLALGYTPRQTFIRIVLPQVIKSVIPIYEGEVISLLKGTSIVGYIAVADMTRASDLIRSRTFDAFFPIIVTAIIYFFMAWLIGRMLRALVKGERLKALIAAVILVIGGTICYLPQVLSSHEQTAAQKDAPAAFQALDGKRVGVVIGSIQDIAVTEMSPGANIQRVATFTDMIAALETGKVDVVGSENLTILCNRELFNKVDTISTGLPSIPIAACFRLGDTELQQDFNQFLAEIKSDGTYKKIVDQWWSVDDPSTLPIPQNTGTGRVLRVATFPAVPPLNFVSVGKESGVEPSILTEWANRRGWKLEYLIMDFASQIPAVQTGKADMAMGAISITEERQKQVLFSDGYFESHILMLTRKGEGGILTDPSQPSAQNPDDGSRKRRNYAIYFIICGGIALLATGLTLRRRAIAKKVADARRSKHKEGEPIIRISHLKKSYGKLVVLKDINADVHPGEVISIIGPSGTGKSTLLRCLNLLDPPTGGKVYIDGKNILAKGYPVHIMRQKMGMVFQSFNLFAHKTVLENITMGPCQLLHEEPAKAREEGLALLRKVGLAEKADVYPDSLSGGQKQRVAIARALAMKPEILLFDEPTSALDPTMVGEVLSVIRQLADEGMTMLIVTHEMKFAQDVSTRIFFMYDGFIHEDGTPEQIFENPVHSATKAFIQRIRKEVFEIDGLDFDYLGMQSGIKAFCYKYGITDKEKKALKLFDLMINDIMVIHRPLTARITHSELTGVTSLDFMVEKMKATPLSEEQRSQLAAQCLEVVEEPTERGFRVKLII